MEISKCLEKGMVSKKDRESMQDKMAQIKKLMSEIN
jgi:hypothetical protein